MIVCYELEKKRYIADRLSPADVNQNTIMTEKKVSLT